MKKRLQHDDISLKPFEEDLNGYSFPTLFRDMGAGLTVALLTIPQAMAYALVAGLPLSCGLFAAIFATIVTALFGSSRHLVVGPSNSIAILIQSGTAMILYTYFRDVKGMERNLMAIQIMTQLTFLVGILQCTAAFFKLGRLIRFVSHSVIIGYITGATIAIIISQTYILLGIPGLQGVHSFWDKGAHLVTNLYQTHWPTALIGFGSIFLLIGLKKVDKRVPSAVITFGLAACAVHYFGYSSYQADPSHLQTVVLVGDTGDIYNGIPALAFPYFNMKIMSSLIPVAIAVALLGILETASVAKTLATNSGQHLSVNQDIFGLSLGNFVSSFIAAMPVSGNSARSILSYNSGSKTRFAAVFSGLFFAVILYAFNSLVSRIPLAALAALMLVTCRRTINTRHLLICLKATSSDALVFWLTLFSCIFFSLDIAFYMGVALSIIFYLKNSAMPQMVEYGINEQGKWTHFKASKEKKQIRIVKIKGELFFGSADLFQSTLKTIAEDDTTTRVIILHMKSARDLDATTCLAIQHLCDFLKGSGRHLICSGLTLQTWEVLSNSGLIAQIGKGNLFMLNEDEPHLHIQKALERANALIAQEKEAEKADAGAIEELVMEGIATGSVS